MPLAIDYHGFKYDAQEAPSYIEINAKFYWHRPASKLLDKPALDAAMAADNYTPRAFEVGAADDWLAKHLGMGHGTHGGGGAGGAPTPPTITLGAANFDTTQAAADGAQGEVGQIDFKFGAGSPVTDADATVTLTVTLTGTGSATETVTAQVPAGSTAQQMESPIVAAWNAVGGLADVQAVKGQGTSIGYQPAAGVAVTGVTVAVT